jgi:hypothetical protein
LSQVKVNKVKEERGGEEKRSIERRGGAGEKDPNPNLNSKRLLPLVRLLYAKYSPN